MSDYDADFYAWTKDQAARLLAGHLGALDLKHLAEEIESLGSEQEHAVESYLVNLLLHLLKWQYQPERQGRSWRNSVMVARQAIARRLRRNPSLRFYLDQVVEYAYRDARELASAQTGLPMDRFPETCPWPLPLTWQRDFWPTAEGEERP
jgi:Domain of unknown function DUF29